MKKIKKGDLEICMLASRFFPDYSGGGRQALTLAKNLITERIKITIISMDFERSIWENNFTFKKLYDIPVYKSPAAIKYRFQLLLRYARLIIVAISLKAQYSIIHAHGLFEGYICYFIAKITNKIIIVKLGGISEIINLCYSRVDNYNWEDVGTNSNKSNSFKYLICRFLIKRIDLIICTTRKVYDLCINLGVEKSKLRIIPNGVDTERFNFISTNKKNESRSLLKIEKDEYTIGTLLTLRPTKGLDLLLEACTKLPKDLRVRVLIVGISLEDLHNSNSHFSKKIISTIGRFSSNISIKFLGFVKDVKPIIPAFDLFILPSRTEGFPNAALEMMSSGLPCIFSEISWTKNIIKNYDNAILYPSEDTNALCDAIVHLFENPNICMKIGQSARKLVINKFSIDLIAKSYINIYQHINLKKMA